MWILLLFIYNVGIEAPTVAFIEKFTSQQECYDVQEYVTNEMQKAYRGEVNFELKCEYHLSKA